MGQRSNCHSICSSSSVIFTLLEGQGSNYLAYKASVEEKTKSLIILVLHQLSPNNYLCIAGEYINDIKWIADKMVIIGMTPDQ